MKKLFFTLFFILCCHLLQAQNRPFVCGTIFTENMRHYEVQNALAKQNLTIPHTYDSQTPYVFNLKFWQINNADGTNIIANHNFTVENEIMEYVKDLNTSFNPFNIFFKYRDFKILNDVMVDDGNGGLSNFSLTNNVNFQNPARYIFDNVGSDCLNIIFAQHRDSNVLFESFSIPEYHSAFIPMDMTTSTTPNMMKLILSHEMGHILGLWHSDGSEGPAYIPPFICEHVSGDNATDHGDYVTDTPAEPLTMYWGTDYNGCNYINSQNQVDCNTTPQLYTGIIPYNFMQRGDFLNVPSLASCATLHFTAGQIVKMRETILTSPYQFYDVNPLSQAMTEVSSLYQPYSDITIGGNNIVSTTDNGDGTATVCRNRIEQQKFQKGFTYTFPENDPLTPDTLSATINEIPVVSYHTFDYPVIIAELAPGQTNLSTNTGTALLTCTKGVICDIETFVYGNLISTQNLLDMNFSIKELNALEVKDPDLFNKLLSEYYYKLKKETASGAKTEQTFYKQ
jgi:hypothetical protein